MSEEHRKAKPGQPAENILRKIPVDETTMPETEAITAEQSITHNS